MLTVVSNNNIPKKHWSTEDILRCHIVTCPTAELTEKIKVIIKFASTTDASDIPFIKGRLANKRVIIYPRKLSGSVFEGTVLPWEMSFFDEDQHEQIMTELIAAIDPKQKRRIVFSLIIDKNETLFTLTNLEYQKDHSHLQVVT